jgi:hypothetical protein
VHKYKNIVSNNKTDAVAVEEKEKCWKRITEEFNFESSNGILPLGCLGPNGGSRNCSEPNGAPGFAQPNGGFTGLTVGARELTHRIALCKTFIYIYTILWTVRPYSRCWVRMTSDL